jgi:sugar phosphate isomerase/epimerase
MNLPNNSQSRRNFLKKSIFIGSLFPLVHEAMPSGFQKKTEKPLKIHIFSKHLQFLNYQDMAEAATEIGFDGVDLSVRPKGHVVPEQVENDLPKAVEALGKAGLAPLMMTTAVHDPDSPVDQRVLETASKLGFQFYRMNYFRYLEGKSIPESIEHFQQVTNHLGQLNQTLGLTGCYQNHAGDYMGASIWELWALLKNADPQHMGAQYDIRHAVVEGGLSWQNGFRLIQPYAKTLAIKDFKWEKNNGKWQALNTPIGEGMVDFKAYFQLLKEYKIEVPMSLHLEYPLGGAEKGATKLTNDKKIVFNAMKRDLKQIHDLWQQV